MLPGVSTLLYGACLEPGAAFQLYQTGGVGRAGFPHCHLQCSVPLFHGPTRICCSANAAARWRSDWLQETRQELTGRHDTEHFYVLSSPAHQGQLGVQAWFARNIPIGWAGQVPPFLGPEGV